MKKVFTLFAAVAFASATFAQTVPNGGFETWSLPSNPDNWKTLGDVFGPAFASYAVQDMVEHVEGSSSVRIKSDTTSLSPFGLAPGMVSLGNQITYVPGQGFSSHGVPFAFKPDTLFFSYKYVPVGNDSAGFSFGMYAAGAQIEGGSGLLPSTQGNWVNVYVPMQYVSATMADSLNLMFQSSTGADTAHVHQGTTLWVDAISWSVDAPSSIKDNAKSIEMSLFPNPSNGVFTVEVEAGTIGNIVISDISGRIVKVVAISSTRTLVNMSNAENGMYTYSVVSAEGATVANGRLAVAK